MAQDREPERHDGSTTDRQDTNVGSDRGGRQSAPQRRRGGSEAATRDYHEQMQELDSAGTVEEAHDRKAGGEPRERLPSGEEPHDRRAGGDAAQEVEAAATAPPSRAARRRAQRAADRASKENGEGTRGSSGSVRELLRDNAMTLGLAASSLALLAGTRGDKPASVAVAEAVVDPPAEVEEKKGVTWDLHVSDHERVDFFKEFLMGKNYDKTRSWLERTGKYAPMIQNELRERGMPEDLLYLTMIESGLNPNAYSKADAAGLWQFIEETGERYGLEVSTYVDERRDPVKSTAAALTYLQEMHGRFDSWYLSAAGYNTGENRVGRLMREITGAEKGSDEGYWSIWERLPRETRDYVPLMLAMGHIAKEPGKYGFNDLKYEQPLAFEEVTVAGGTKLADVAKAAGVDSEVVYDLNPHFVKKQTPPNRRMAVRVPVGQGQQVAAALGGEKLDTTVFAD